MRSSVLSIQAALVTAGRDFPRAQEGEAPPGMTWFVLNCRIAAAGCATSPAAGFLLAAANEGIRPAPARRSLSLLPPNRSFRRRWLALCSPWGAGMWKAGRGDGRSGPDKVAGRNTPDAGTLRGNPPS